MAFFLVERKRDTGSLALLSDSVFETREEALAGLSQLMAETGHTASEVFVSDLDAATPVLFVPHPAAPADEEAVTVEEPPAEESAHLHEPVVDEAVDTQEPPVEETLPVEHVEVEAAPVTAATETLTESIVAETPLEAVESDLAAALRRAATSLESEGIVPPESIPADTDVAAEPIPAGEMADDDIVATIASLGMDDERQDVAGIEPVAYEAPAEAPAEPENQWPWANVEPVEADAEVAEPEDLSADEVDMVFTSKDAGDFMPRPVIMGDYGDTAAVAAEQVVEAEEVAGAETAVEEAPEAPVSVQDERMEQEAAAPVYEPGEVSLDEYTCDDCVYANTCPKAGASSPAECGSFQWKAV